LGTALNGKEEKMAIPRGRFAWNFHRISKSDAQKIVKRWDGVVATDAGPYGTYVYYVNSGEVSLISLPPVLSTAGLFYLTFSRNNAVAVTLGPKERDAKWQWGTGRYYLDYTAENTPVYSGWSYWGFFMNWWDEGSPHVSYQSYGSNIYTIATAHGRDPKRIGTVSIIVARGTHIASGQPSCIMLAVPNSTDQNWANFHFYIWNPVINNWITGDVSGIRQSLRDDSHILISPLELNGYSFPNLYLADGEGNKAFSAYCSPDQLKYYDKAIKKVTLSGDTYYIPITYSSKTVLLIKQKPDDVTVL
jgi:hypothetical protein